LELIFYIAGLVAVLSTLGMLFSRNPVHGLLYLIISLLSVAIVYFVVGAPFAGVLEFIVYAGAILVLFVFVVMMLNLGDLVVQMEKSWMQPKNWIVPVILSSILLVLVLTFLFESTPEAIGHPVSIKQVGIAMYGPYILAVELASLILLAALVTALYLGRREESNPEDTQ
jgi:NADH-quinone oxidoreductase subunit J